jgi:hypothetical protein
MAKNLTIIAACCAPAWPSLSRWARLCSGHRPWLGPGADGAREHHPHPGDDLRLRRPQRLRAGEFRTPRSTRWRRGIRFTQYYAGSTVCAPSRAALMTGLHTGHTWIRGNGEIPLRDEDVTIARRCARPAIARRWSASGARQARNRGDPNRKGFDYAFGFLDHRHAHRQFTDHLYATASATRRTSITTTSTISSRRKRSASSRRRTAAVLPVLELHGAARRAARAEDSLAPLRGTFPETPFVNATADAKPTGADEASLGYRSQPTPKAAFAAMIVRMDRDIGAHRRSAARAGIERETL